MSGWCPALSASAATPLTKNIASLKLWKRYVRSSVLLTRVQPGVCSSSAGPPRRSAGSSIEAAPDQRCPRAEWPRGLAHDLRTVVPAPEGERVREPRVDRESRDLDSRHDAALQPERMTGGGGQPGE